MKGKLIKIEERWMVGTVCYADLWSNYMPLHPDDVGRFLPDDEEFAKNNPEVEFEIVKDYFRHYAKLIPSKEQQKQLITEIMDLDAKDGLYKDEVDKLAHQYNPVMKLDAEFIRAGFKAGYNKAKSTLYTEEQVIKFAEWCRDKAVSETVYGNVEKTNNWELRGQQKVLTTKELLQEFVKSLKQPKKD